METLSITPTIHDIEGKPILMTSNHLGRFILGEAIGNELQPYEKKIKKTFGTTYNEGDMAETYKES